MQGPNLRPAVLAARERLEQGRAKVRQLHESGSPAGHVCAFLTDVLDGIVLDLYESALAELPNGGELASQLTLVALGGYGRRDIAPFSDLDLMLLYAPGSEGAVTPLARSLTQHVCDAGLVLGHSFRTPAEACRLALRDATVFTSLAEARYLGGSVRLYTRFARRLRRDARRHFRRLLASIEQARDKERQEFGETVYLLKPNVKKSLGGLRDLQLVRWIGFARYGESEPENLRRMNVLSPEDLRRIRDSHAFLLRLRNELHLRAGRPQDVLGRHEQVELAERFGYQGSAGVLPVEEFMREYFERTGEGRYAVEHFVASVRWSQDGRRFFRPLFSHMMERDFRVGPVHIAATRRGLPKVCNDLAEVLRLMDLANQYGSRIDHDTWEAIRSAMTDRNDLELTPEAIRRFLALLSSPGRLAELLRRLHEMRVLEKIVPPMKHARCLLQFNEYHKYTVDEHTLRAVQAATDFRNDERPVREAYQKIKRKDLLHLALLLHDLGKGYPEDHSEVGRRLAAEIAQRFGLSSQDSQTLQFLVHKHLMMAHMAFRQDLDDPGVIVKLAVEVGSLEVLQLLYVLTCADLDAVGPNVLNNWKLDLLTELYERTRRHLAGEPQSARGEERVRQRRGRILETVLGGRPATVRRAAARSAERPAVDEPERTWWTRLVDSLPASYLLDRSDPQVVDDLLRLRQLPRNQAVAWGRYLPDREVVEYTVSAYEDVAPGIFHRLTGALTRKSNQILSAEIHTLSDGLILDRFFVSDEQSNGAPGPARLEEVCDEIQRALTTPAGERPTFPVLWRNRLRDDEAQLQQQPASVHFDNSSSERFTIVSVFAYDFMGLLYTISRVLFDAGLSVHLAKISTHLDQVVDVFYVSDEQGRRVTDEPRLKRLREELLQEITQQSQASRTASAGR